MEGNLAYKEEPRMEIIGGKVVMMASPVTNHIFTAANIYTIFDHYLRGKHCTPFPDGETLFLEKGEEYKPDMMVVCDPDQIRRRGVYGTPDLVAEVLSPSTAIYDRGIKKNAYERSGVREYWILDPANRTVEQYLLEDSKYVLRNVYTHYLPDELSDMTEEERSALVTEFRCSLFADLVIRLEDVFYRVMSGG